MSLPYLEVQGARKTLHSSLVSLKPDKMRSPRSVNYQLLICNLVLYLTESAVAECGFPNLIGTRYWGNGGPESVMYLNIMYLFIQANPVFASLVLVSVMPITFSSKDLRKPSYVYCIFFVVRLYYHPRRYITPTILRIVY